MYGAWVQVLNLQKEKMVQHQPNFDLGVDFWLTSAMDLSANSALMQSKNYGMCYWLSALFSVPSDYWTIVDTLILFSHFRGFF